jgi:hypothetical protein
LLTGTILALGELGDVEMEANLDAAIGQLLSSMSLASFSKLPLADRSNGKLPCAPWFARIEKGIRGKSNREID